MWFSILSAPASPGDFWGNAVSVVLGQDLDISNFKLSRRFSGTKLNHQHCCCSVAKWCLTLCDPMDCSTPAPLSSAISQWFLKLMSIKSMMPSKHLIFCFPLFLLPSIFPSIRVFPNESTFCIRWLKYWRSSFCISPSNEYSALISFRIDWFDCLSVQGTLKSFL